MEKYEIIKSSRKNKRYMIVNSNGKKLVHFGSPDYDNYSIHHDDKRREQYLSRHGKE